ncbi:hypothetical protein GCM10010279_62970 [Streptomyces mutabilis]|nr:hypothetical protein GCM10010279_62970 [Streptomyces mutabilis]
MTPPGATAPGPPFALNGLVLETPDGLGRPACPASSLHLSSRTRTFRSVTDVRTAAPAGTTAPAIAAACIPLVNASRAAVARASPARPGNCPATAGALPSVSCAASGAESGISCR